MPDGSEDPQRLGLQSVGQIKKDITNLSPEAKQSVATETIQALPPEEKENVAAEVVRSLSADAKQGVASETLQALSPEATKDVATEAMQSLPPETKKTVATEMARALSPEDQADLVGRLQGPTQQITNQIWQIIVWTFAIVLVLSVGALIVAAFWTERAGTNIQILLTVVTTVAGILAGFVSGRASSGRQPG
jgi:hypothetical protein